MVVKKVGATEQNAEVEVKENGVEGRTNEVAVKEETALVENSFVGLDLEALGYSKEELAELTGLDAIDASEIRIPYATLIQKPNKNNGWVQGDLVLPDGTVVKCYDGEVIANASVLAVLKVRSYFPEKFDPKNSFICRSLDGKVGADDGTYAGRPCAECEFAKYPEGGGASPCRDQRLLVLALEDGSLMHMNVSGIGVKSWKDFMSAQVFHLLPKVHNLLPALKVAIGAKAQDTDFGEFACPTFTIDKKDATHTVEKIKENLNSLKSYNEFKQDHLKSAAIQTQIQRAIDGEDLEASGENSEAF